LFLAIRNTHMRSILFDSSPQLQKTAERFIQYWKARVTLWGEEIAYRRITVADFSEDDMKTMMIGSYIACRHLDEYERGIMIVDSSRINGSPSHRVGFVSFQIEYPNLAVNFIMFVTLVGVFLPIVLLNHIFYKSKL
jgi:hypothetical protein